MTQEDETRAAAIVGQWFWQMSEGHNFRWKNAVKSMTLFYESAPMESDVAQLVLEYLRSLSGVTELPIGHKRWTFDGPGWNTKDVWYQTAQGERWAGTESTKVRVYWVLAQAGDGTADGPYIVENGCKYRVSHSYYWDVAAEPELPQSSSGVQYAIQGFTRDRETGLFTYVVEKRETVEQSIPLYDSAKTIFETVSEAQHLGVKQGDVDSTGLAASVGGGVRVERRLSKNADCTTDIQNRKIEDWKVESSRTSVHKTLRGTSETTSDRNLTPAEVAVKTVTPQQIGETRTVEKTDSDLRNLTIDRFTPGQLPLVVAESCERETSVHTDVTIEAVDVESVRPVEQTAETNKLKTVSYRRNDDGRTADRTTQTRTWSEKTGNGATDSGAGAVVSTTERKENTTAVPPAESGVNKVVEIDVQPNDHGSASTVKRVTSYRPEKRTTTGGTASYTDTVEAGIHQVAAPAGGAGGPNTVVDVSVSLNDHGSMSTQKRTRVYRETEAVAVSSYATETVTTTTRHNTGASPAAQMGNASAQPNEHGTLTTQVSEIVPHPIDSGWKTWNSTTRTTRGRYTYLRGMRVFLNMQDVPASGHTDKDLQVNFHVNRYGLYDGAMSFTQLVRYEENESGASGLFGGIQNGTIRYKGRSYGVVTFYGSGNEGTEADVRTSCIYVPGLHLPPRTYVTSGDDDGGDDPPSGSSGTGEG